MVMVPSGSDAIVSGGGIAQGISRCSGSCTGRTACLLLAAVVSFAAFPVSATEGGGNSYPMGVERSGMTFQFSKWNQKVKIARPAKSDVVGIDKLGLDGLSADALNSELGGQLAGHGG